MSDPGNWNLVKDLFGRASELQPEDRAAFLDQETTGDPGLRARVESLLAADSSALDFLDEPAGASMLPNTSPDASDNPWLGRRLGAYEVTGELGRGGVGVVLQGIRADGLYARTVAIKIVPATLLPGPLLARFQSEIRILGGLDHPNIARLLDAGQSSEGLTYLVMEHVDGPRMDRYADEARLDVHDRLRLFLAALEGVRCAHGLGIVHRDLKPSNILVTRSGVPKLVDFGIAKLLDPGEGPGEGRPAETRSTIRMMTPEYASPEQVRGERVDGRSDIYSLGIILYRLLSGRAPYDLDPTLPQSAERVICEESPSRPSDAVLRASTQGPGPQDPTVDADEVARLRSTTPGTLSRHLRRAGLDAVVLRALEKDPDRRYPDVAAFAADVRRALDGSPVLATLPGWVRRTGRTLRRRRVAALVLATGLVAGGAITWQSGEARSQRRAAEARDLELSGVVASVLNTLNTDLTGENPGPTATRASAVEAAVASLDDLLARSSRRPPPALLRQLALAYQEVGSLQGHPGSANVGRTDDAEVSFRRSMELWGRLAGVDGGSVDARSGRLQTEILLADVHLVRGRFEEAEALLRASAATLDSLVAENEPTQRLLALQMMSLERRAFFTDLRGDLTATTELVAAAAERSVERARLEPEGPARLAMLEGVVHSLQRQSYILAKADDREGSIEVQRRAEALADSLANQPGATLRMRAMRADASAQFGWRYNDADRPQEAEARFTEALTWIRTLRAEDPRNQNYLLSEAQFLEGRGQARIRGRRWEAALEDHNRALELLTPLVTEFPMAIVNVGQAHRQRGEALTRLGRFDEAAEAYRLSHGLSQEFFQVDTTSALARKILALGHLSHALHLRLRAAAEGDDSGCSEAVATTAEAQGHWEWLRERSQAFPNEERIWASFEGMMPPGVCPGEGREEGSATTQTSPAGRSPDPPPTAG